MADLRQSLRQERDKTEAMARDLESVPRTIDGRVTLERAANSQIAQVTQGIEAAATEQPAAAASQGGLEVARLMVRAAHCSAREISARRGRCWSALRRPAAHGQVSRSRRPTIPSFSPHGGHTERAAMRPKRGSSMPRLMPVEFRRRRIDWTGWVRERSGFAGAHCAFPGRAQWRQAESDAQEGADA
jgi:hypothetical protein